MFECQNPGWNKLPASDGKVLFFFSFSFLWSCNGCTTGVTFHLFYECCRENSGVRVFLAQTCGILCALEEFGLLNVRISLLIVSRPKQTETHRLDLTSGKGDGVGKCNALSSIILSPRCLSLKGTERDVFNTLIYLHSPVWLAVTSNSA